jgi:hypothetical protein
MTSPILLNPGEGQAFEIGKQARDRKVLHMCRRL